MNIVAIISTFNEGDIIAQVVDDFIKQGIAVYILDDDSTDDTIDKVRPFLGHGLIGFEPLPPRKNNQYNWTKTLLAKERVSSTLGADWYLHTDADEFRESPWEGVSLKQGIERVNREGYTAINFRCFDFLPTNELPFDPNQDVREQLTYYKIRSDKRQIKAWKNTGRSVEIAKNAGHDINFQNRKVYPILFNLRHYPMRSAEHACKKILQERLPLYAPEERKKGWHTHYSGMEESKFIWNKDTLVKWGDRPKEPSPDGPSVACVMLYFGRYKLAQEACESYFRQTYQNKRLLIVNVHPQPISVSEAYMLGRGEKVDVVNICKPFPTIGDFYNHAWSMVSEDYLCNWEDDDIWLPWHIEDRIREAQSHLTRNGHNAPLSVWHEYHFYSVAGRLQPKLYQNWLSQAGRMWQAGAYQAPSSSVWDQEWAGTKLGGEKNTWENVQFSFPKMPSYIYRRDSDRNMPNNDVPPEAHQAAFERGTAEKAALFLPPVFTPFWNEDYTATCESMIKTMRSRRMVPFHKPQPKRV